MLAFISPSSHVEYSSGKRRLNDSQSNASSRSHPGETASPSSSSTMSGASKHCASLEGKQMRCCSGRAPHCTLVSSSNEQNPSSQSVSSRQLTVHTPHKQLFSSPQSS